MRDSESIRRGLMQDIANLSAERDAINSEIQFTNDCLRRLGFANSANPSSNILKNWEERNIPVTFDSEDIINELNEIIEQ